MEYAVVQPVDGFKAEVTPQIVGELCENLVDGVIERRLVHDWLPCAGWLLILELSYFLITEYVKVVFFGIFLRHE